MFDKLTDIIGIPVIALDKYKVRMNKWDDELKDFMLSAKNKCRTCRNN